jgi:thiamine transport system permease protein
VFGRKGWISTISEMAGGGGLGTFVYGLSGILIAHVFLNAPFAAYNLLQRLERLPPDRLKLSASLGLTPLQRFRIVEWPALRSSFYALSATVFLLCFTSFAIVLTLGGSPKYNTLEVAIYEAIKLDFDLSRAVSLALVQVIVCGAFVLIASGGGRHDRSIRLVNRMYFWPDSPMTRTFQITVIAIFSVFFLGPIISLVWDGLFADFSRLVQEKSFRQALITSLVLASLSSFITLIVALAIAGTKRSLSSPLRVEQSRLTDTLSRLLSFSGSIYLAVPSLVMGFGFFLIARSLTTDFYQLAPVALVVANVLIALPFALVVLTPAMEKLALRHDKLAFSLGVRGLDRWRLVEWPGLRREIGYVVALAFCFSLGDLGVIALFGNQDFSTLPWLLYQKMGAYRTADAAGIALILLLLTLGAFYLLPRLFKEKDHA